MTDPLAQFRKTPLTTGKSLPPTKESDAYVAFNAKDKVERLRIRRANDQTHSPVYGVLTNISYDGPFGTNFVLTYTFLMMVFVEGKNLLPVIAAIENGMADFIQEYDPDRWEMPKDPDAPFIESITIEMQEGGPSLSEGGGSDNATKH